MTPSGDSRTDIEPVGNPHEAVAACERHVPATHDDPEAHALPQAPQLFGSDRVLTQRLLHCVWFGEHAVSAATHAPALQTWLEASAPPQLVPSAAVGFEHVPVAGLQAPATWQASAGAQAAETPPTHAPAWHESPCVHALWSLHAVPSAAAGFEHVPLVGSHVPATWHASLAVHVTGLDPVHVPATHA